MVKMVDDSIELWLWHVIGAQAGSKRRVGYQRLRSSPVSHDSRILRSICGSSATCHLHWIELDPRANECRSPTHSTFVLCFCITNDMESSLA